MFAALLGFGTVGSSFYALTRGRTDIRVAAVLSRRPRPELSCRVTPEFDTILRDPSVGIVVEAIGGLHPAYEYVCAAMEAGKHVVTANKHLMVAWYDELIALARRCGVSLRCTAAAAGGIPWLPALSRRRGWMS
jgi:homoserine dehydrogenase